VVEDHSIDNEDGPKPNEDGPTDPEEDSPSPMKKRKRTPKRKRAPVTLNKEAKKAVNQAIQQANPTSKKLKSPHKKKEDRDLAYLEKIASETEFQPLRFYLITWVAASMEKSTNFSGGNDWKNCWNVILGEYRDRPELQPNDYVRISIPKHLIPSRFADILPKKIMAHHVYKALMFKEFPTKVRDVGSHLCPRNKKCGNPYHITWEDVAVQLLREQQICPGGVNCNHGEMKCIGH
jgi:hypothetical protein